MAHQSIRIHWFGDTLLTKLYKYNGVRARSLPNVTYTMVWGCMAHQTLQTHWFDCPGSPSITYTIVWGRIAHQTLQITWFEGPWLITQYVYNGLGAHGSPNNTNIMI